MFLLLAGVATAFNFLIILWKYGKERYVDATIDTGIFIAICILFSSTVTGLQIGMIASFIVSVALLIKPPKLSFL
jgi:hypothetical protein